MLIWSTILLILTWIINFIHNNCLTHLTLFKFTFKCFDLVFQHGCFLYLILHIFQLHLKVADLLILSTLFLHQDGDLLRFSFTSRFTLIIILNIGGNKFTCSNLVKLSFLLLNITRSAFFLISLIHLELFLSLLVLF